MFLTNSNLGQKIEFKRVKLTNTTFNNYKIKLTTTNSYSVNYHFIREKKNPHLIREEEGEEEWDRNEFGGRIEHQHMTILTK